MKIGFADDAALATVVGWLTSARGKTLDKDRTVDKQEQWVCRTYADIESVLFVLPRKLRFRSPHRAGHSGACRSDLPHTVTSFLASRRFSASARRAPRALNWYRA
jgi:hypothetical protein